MSTYDVNKMGNIKNQQVYDAAKKFKEAMTVSLGDYYTYCCELDFSWVSTEEERKDLQELLDEGNELGILVWHSEDEVKEFYKHSSEYQRVLDVIKQSREEVNDNEIS